MLTVLAPLTAPLITLTPAPHPLTLSAPQTPNLQPAYLLLVASARDTRQSLSARYGVPPQDVRLDAALSQPAVTQPLGGQTVRIALPLTPATGRAAPGIRKVTVRPGDTLSRLMRRYNLTERELISANLDLGSLDNLSAGRTLNIPTATRGLLLTIKAGQNAAELMADYHADPLWTAKVNQFTLPTELRPGDQLLLPGIFAKSRQEELLAKRQQARMQAQQERILARYNSFLAWKAARERERAAQYQRYQAWLTSPQRLAAVARYKRQAAFETWQAHEARAQLKAQQAAQQAAQVQAQLQAQREAQEAAQQAAQEAQAQQELRTQMAALSASDPRPQMQAAAQAEATAPALHLSWPVDHPRLTSGFGEEDIALHQELFHGGQDMAAAEGTPIYAAASGTVTQSGEGAYGINVYVEQAAEQNGAAYTVTYIYGHMHQASVQVGQQVKQGDLLGYVGCTGMCTGPHLHFEVRLGGVPVDPMMFLPQDRTAKINTPAPPMRAASNLPATPPESLPNTHQATGNLPAPTPSTVVFSPSTSQGAGQP